jgi:hypothetical protein
MISKMSVRAQIMHACPMTEIIFEVTLLKGKIPGPT